jgi:hypothetical protein
VCDNDLRLSRKLRHAERENGKLEACLADFGLSVVLPAPLEQKNSLMLSVAPSEHAPCHLTCIALPMPPHLRC